MNGAELEQTATIPIERQLLLIESIGEIRSVTTDHYFSIKIKPDRDETLPILPSIKDRLKNVSLPPNIDDPDIHAIHARNSPFLLIAVHGAESPATCNRSAEYLNRFIGDRGRTECENGPGRLNGDPIGLINVYSAEQEDQILLRKSIQEHMPAGMKIIDDASLLLERQFTTIELCLAVFFGLTVLSGVRKNARAALLFPVTSLGLFAVLAIMMATIDLSINIVSLHFLTLVAPLLLLLLYYAYFQSERFNILSVPVFAALLFPAVIIIPLFWAKGLFGKLVHDALIALLISILICFLLLPIAHKSAISAPGKKTLTRSILYQFLNWSKWRLPAALLTLFILPAFFIGAIFTQSFFGSFRLLPSMSANCIFQITTPPNSTPEVMQKNIQRIETMLANQSASAVEFFVATPGSHQTGADDPRAQFGPRYGQVWVRLAGEVDANTQIQALQLEDRVKGLLDDGIVLETRLPERMDSDEAPIHIEFTGNNRNRLLHEIENYRNRIADIQHIVRPQITSREYGETYLQRKNGLAMEEITAYPAPHFTTEEALARVAQLQVNLPAGIDISIPGYGELNNRTIDGFILAVIIATIACILASIGFGVYYRSFWPPFYIFISPFTIVPGIVFVNSLLDMPIGLPAFFAFWTVLATALFGVLHLFDNIRFHSETAMAAIDSLPITLWLPIAMSIAAFVAYQEDRSLALDPFLLSFAGGLLGSSIFLSTGLPLLLLLFDGELTGVRKVHE